MLKTVVRLLLLRVLPRRILPVVTVVEALLFLRSIRRRSRAKVNPPTTGARPAPPAGPTATGSPRSSTNPPTSTPPS